MRKGEERGLSCHTKFHSFPSLFPEQQDKQREERLVGSVRPANSSVLLLKHERASYMEPKILSEAS